MKNIDDEQKKETRGGRREGAGRKTKGGNAKVKTLSFCCTPAQGERLDAEVAASGLSRSDYIVRKLFGEN